MSVKVIKVETNEYRILVKVGDEELARKEAVKAAISAEAARLSAIAADESEQVATQKAAEALEDAASALASKQDAESSATASWGFATDSGNFAAASELANELSEAAKVIAIEEAGKSFVSATESAESAAAAEDAKNQILDKAQINVTTLGRILRANGTLFESISEVEFLRNKQAFQKSVAFAVSALARVEIWDSFHRPNQTGLGLSDSGHTWLSFSGAQSFDISNNLCLGNSVVIPTTFANVIDRGALGAANTNLGLGSAELGCFYSTRISEFGFILAVNDSNYLYTRLLTGTLEIYSVIDNVETLLTTINVNVAPIKYTNSEESYFLKMYWRTGAGGKVMTFNFNDMAGFAFDISGALRTYLDANQIRFFGIRMRRTSAGSNNRIRSFYIRNIDGAFS